MTIGSTVPCRLFGLHLRTHIAPPCIYRGGGPVELEIAPRESHAWDFDSLGAPAFSVHMHHPDGDGEYAIWPRGDSLVLRVGPIAAFECLPNRLEFQPLRTVTEEALQWQTFGLVLSAWSEWAGRPVLHAATVEVGHSAVGFLGRSGAGKSSLTLELLKHHHRILGDDQLILRSSPEGVCALPAVPWLKLGPEVARSVGLDPERLPRIHSALEKRRLDLKESEWSDGPVPLGPLYLVERRDDAREVGIEALTPAESLVELIRHSYVPRTVAHSGLAGARLDLLARAVEQGGVWRLRYPNGLDWLPRVREAVVLHASSLPVRAASRA